MYVPSPPIGSCPLNKFGAVPEQIVCDALMSKLLNVPCMVIVTTFSELLVQGPLLTILLYKVVANNAGGL